MKARLVQFQPVLGDVDKNMNFHRQQIKKAVNDRIELVVFPELSISGYHLKDLAYEIALKPDDDIINELKELSRKIDIIIGAPLEREKGIIYNAALYFSGGELTHTHLKVQLPTFGMFEEGLIFKAGDRFLTCQIGPFKAGFLICREILFPTYAYLYYLQQVDLLIGISNSPFRQTVHGPSTSWWEMMGELFGQFYGLNYLFVNRSGFEEGIAFGGGSFFVPAGGHIKAKAKYFDDDILDININAEDIRQARISGHFLRDEKPEIVLKELTRIVDNEIKS